MRRVLVPRSIDPRGPAVGGHVHALSGHTMGTTWSVRWVGPAVVDASAWRGAIQAELDAVVAEMSTWEAGSDLSRFNALPEGAWCTLPPACFEVLTVGLEVAALTSGAFDPAAGGLVDLWGFGARGRYDEPAFMPPSRERAVAESARANWRRLEVDAPARRVRQPGGLRLDFSGIAKGHAVDRVAERLTALGAADHLVEVGGELRGAGVKPGGQPWWVDLQQPPGAPAGLCETRLALHGLAVATSGDYLRRYTWDGVAHSHTIDPRTGMPLANGVVSVSVIHAEAMRADAWATALTVLGPEAALARADADRLAMLLIERDGQGQLREHLSPALREMAE